jgi:Tol biopolymer transport system component
MGLGITRRGLSAVGIACVALCAVGCSSVFVTRLTVSSDEAQSDVDVSTAFSVSGDGRFTAFQSPATTLVGGDTNATSDIFVRDALNGTTERVSLTSTGAQSPTTPLGNVDPSISANGRWVAFTGWGPLVPEVTGGTQIYVRDRQADTTELISTKADGSPAGSASNPKISGDGRYVAYVSSASGIVQGVTATQLYLRDRQGGTVWASPTLDGLSSNATVDSVSSDGRYVLFHSASSNLVGGDTNAAWDVFRFDRTAAAVTRVSVSTNGTQGNGASSLSTSADMSSDGRYVTFISSATNLVDSDTNAIADVFVRDTISAVTTRVNLTDSGEQATGTSSSSPTISDDGRWVAFALGSPPSNLFPTSSCRTALRDRTGGRTTCAGTNALGSADGQPPAGAGPVQISDDGRYVVSRNNHNGLVADDTCCFDLFLQSVPLPTVTSSSPTSVARGSTTTIDISGTNFLPGITVGGSAGISVVSLDRLSETHLRATISVATTAAAGNATVTVLLTGTGPGPASGASATFLMTVV